MNATGRPPPLLTDNSSSVGRDYQNDVLLSNLPAAQALQQPHRDAASPPDIPLPPRPKLRISGIAELVSSLIFVDAMGQYKESYGTVDTDTLFEIPEGCVEIILCVDTLKGIPPKVRIEVLHSRNGIQETVAEFDKRRLNSFFWVHKQHALHPTDRKSVV